MPGLPSDRLKPADADLCAVAGSASDKYKPADVADDDDEDDVPGVPLNKHKQADADDAH